MGICPDCENKEDLNLNVCGTCGQETCNHCHSKCKQCKDIICVDCEAQDFLCEECLFKNKSCDLCRDNINQYSCELCHNKICESCNKPCSQCKKPICEDCYEYLDEGKCEYCVQDENMKKELNKDLTNYELSELNNLIRELKEENKNLKKENEELTNKLLSIKKILK